MDYSSSCKELMKQLLFAAIKCKVNPNYGFSLLEALVGILVITTFTLAALQAMVLATVFRVKAEQESGATNWIQEQVEEAKFQAFQLDLTGDNDPNTDGDNDSSTPGPAQRCGNADDSNQDNGYGDALQTRLSNQQPITGTEDIDITNEDTNEVIFTGDVIGRKDQFPGPEMVLLRNATPSNKEPFQVLELEYVAVLDRDQSDDNLSTTTPHEDDIVAELYTEVIPDEAFACN